jgi:hypothetical protein
MGGGRFNFGHLRGSLLVFLLIVVLLALSFSWFLGLDFGYNRDEFTKHCNTFSRKGEGGGEGKKGWIDISHEAPLPFKGSDVECKNRDPGPYYLM